jgi:NAD(P)-dependent dehydrogenase (short-subunit alcohol dehydrogenase family)
MLVRDRRLLRASAEARRVAGLRHRPQGGRPEPRLKVSGFETFYLDYREPDTIAALFADVMQATGGRLDALYNNGAYSQAGAVEDLPTEALREQFEANSSAGTI